MNSVAASAQRDTPSRASQANLPILFEPSAAHSAGQTSVLGRTGGMTLSFRPSAFAIDLQAKQPTHFEIDFAGASPVKPIAEKLQASQTNYLIGNDPEQWRTHVPNFSRVAYRGLYPGIDAVFYGNGHQMEHDFIVAPGFDYHQIRMHLSERAHASLDRDGNLTISLADSRIQMLQPEIYQQEAGQRQRRSGAFRLLSNGDVSFTIAHYNHAEPLIIDPVLSFATYLYTATTKAVLSPQTLSEIPTSRASRRLRLKPLPVPTVGARIARHRTSLPSLQS